MDNRKHTLRLISDCPSSAYNDLSTFSQTYVNKLIYNLLTYVDNSITVSSIELANSYYGRCEYSQEITGVPGAYSCIDSDESTLLAFAKAYSQFDIDKFDLLAKEVLLDFLNLHNGLFVVQLSTDNICELSLDVPKQNGNYSHDFASYKSITIISVMFTYGTIKFLLCEL